MVEQTLTLLRQKANAFRALHVAGAPLVIFNVWDVGTARAAVAAGAQAIATGSWSVATANGFDDGERIPVELALANLARIARAVDLPVSIDIESGYGKTAKQVERTIASTIEAGAIGCNLEDSDPGNGQLRAIAEQVERIRHARSAAEAADVDFFVNARTDVFFQGPPAQHDDSMVDAALQRARAYADAGASGIFVPGVVDLKKITRICAASPLPVNVMVSQGTPGLDALADAGVARVSHGPGPYVATMKAFEDLARAALGVRRTQ